MKKLILLVLLTGNIARGETPGCYPKPLPDGVEITNPGYAPSSGCYRNSDGVCVDAIQGACSRSYSATVATHGTLVADFCKKVKRLKTRLAYLARGNR